jgi:hypothetical protein
MNFIALDDAYRSSTIAQSVPSAAPAESWGNALQASGDRQTQNGKPISKSAQDQPVQSPARPARQAVQPAKAQKLTETEVVKIWNGLPVYEKPEDAETAARALFSAARRHRTPHSRAAIMVGESHDAKGMMAIYRSLFKSAKAEDCRTFLMELGPKDGKLATDHLPTMEKNIRKAGGLNAYMRSMPDEDVWGVLPILTVREALRHGLNVDFIDHDTADDTETRNKTMVRGIRKHIDAGKNVIVFNGALHVPDMQRSLLQNKPGHRPVNAVSAQFIFPFSKSVKRGSIESFRKSPVPRGRAQLVRVSDAMKDYVPA